ncbi:hypothetical protein BB561_001151 [Smittium simulii]|uniref:DH domain-containing protein n=1 Tax=Smittium simulii TaxID=133385 RepID=A0A2T9YVW2_9FUNG|nr:hypothetical protein BB561_001151 [Smittium simulii]
MVKKSILLKKIDKIVDLSTYLINGVKQPSDDFIKNIQLSDSSLNFLNNSDLSTDPNNIDSDNSLTFSNIYNNASKIRTSLSSGRPSCELYNIDVYYESESDEFVSNNLNKGSNSSLKKLYLHENYSTDINISSKSAFRKVNIFSSSPCSDKGELSDDSCKSIYSLEFNNKNIHSSTNLDSEICASHQNLCQIPQSIFYFSNVLTKLDISFNRIDHLPLQLFDLVNLQTLLAKKNKITHIPPEIKNLKNLTFIDFSHNKLSEIAFELTFLKKLSVLNLQHNMIAEIPSYIGLLYTSLESLKIHDNPLDYTSIYLISPILDRVQSYKMQHNVPTELYPSTNKDFGKRQKTPEGLMFYEDQIFDTPNSGKTLIETKCYDQSDNSIDSPDEDLYQTCVSTPNKNIQLDGSLKLGTNRHQTRSLLLSSIPNPDFLAINSFKNLDGNSNKSTDSLKPQSKLEKILGVNPVNTNNTNHFTGVEPKNTKYTTQSSVKSQQKKLDKEIESNLQNINHTPADQVEQISPNKPQKNWYSSINLKSFTKNLKTKKNSTKSKPSQTLAIDPNIDLSYKPTEINIQQACCMSKASKILGLNATETSKDSSLHYKNQKKLNSPVYSPTKNVKSIDNGCTTLADSPSKICFNSKDLTTPKSKHKTSSASLFSMMDSDFTKDDNSSSDSYLSSNSVNKNGKKNKSVNSIKNFEPKFIPANNEKKSIGCDAKKRFKLSKVLMQLLDIWDLDKANSEKAVINKVLQEKVYKSPKRASILSVAQLEPQNVQKQYYNVAKELLETEKVYVEGLSKIVNKYLIPLSESEILTKAEIKTLFSNIKVIYDLHNIHLLQDLIEDEKTQFSNIGSIVTKYTPLFKLYTEYINNFEKAQAICEKLESTITKKTNNQSTISSKGIGFLSTHELTIHKTVGKAMSIFEGSSASNKLSRVLFDLPSLLITPVQRIPRYKLLLERLIKYACPSGKDFEDLRNAYDQTLSVTHDINESKRRHEQVDIVRRLSQSANQFLVKKKINPNSRIIKCGLLILKKIVTPNTNMQQVEKVISTTVSIESNYYLINGMLLKCGKTDSTYAIQEIHTLSTRLEPASIVGTMLRVVDEKSVLYFLTENHDLEDWELKINSRLEYLCY